MQLLQRPEIRQPLGWQKFTVAIFAFPVMVAMGWHLAIQDGFVPVVEWPRIITASVAVVWLLTVLRPAPGSSASSTAQRLLRLLYLFAVFPYLLRYLELPFTQGPFPFVEFVVEYGLEMLFALTLTWAITLAFRLPKPWQRWAVSVGFVVLGFGVVSGIRLMLQ